MARSRRIPDARLAILFHRPFLEKHFPARILHENVRSAVHQAETMDFGARTAVDDFIAVIYDIKDFVGMVGGREAARWRISWA